MVLGECVEVTAAHATVKHPIEVEDTAVATLRFASGGLATLSASTALTPGLGTRVLVTGPGGTAGARRVPGGVRGGQRRVGRTRPREAVRPPFGPGLRPDIPLSAINGSLVPFHALQIADFVDAVRAGREPAVTGRDAAKIPGHPHRALRLRQVRAPGAGADPGDHLMNTPIGIAHLTLLRLSPPELVTTAAEAGYDFVGIRVKAVTEGEHQYPMAARLADVARDAAAASTTPA